jgi:hypothetical protein
MMWVKVELYKKIEVGTDRLGNPRTVYSDPYYINGRLTQWNADDVNLYGRELTKTTRKLLTPSRKLETNHVIGIEGLKYKIKYIEDLGRFKLCFIERFNYEV